MFDQKLIYAILQEIDNYLNQRVMTVHNAQLNHLGQEDELLRYLLHLQKEGLISGNLISKGIDGTPYKMVNIRLTYAGTKALRSYHQQLQVA